MVQSLICCCFSPTGGTKAVAHLVCSGLSAQTKFIDLADPSVQHLGQLDAELVVVAAPVYAGRIPPLVIQKLQTLQSAHIPTVTLAVYGNRDFDDALLELNDTMQARGFPVLASAACIAQHSMIPTLAQGRPDAKDQAGLAQFSAGILAKAASGKTSLPPVDGHRPYGPSHSLGVTPLTTDACNRCGICAKCCPTGAIGLKEHLETDASRCILCMACVARCPQKARILPPPALEKLHALLDPCLHNRRENVYYL